MSYTGISGNDLTGCTRGASGTTAASHSDDVTVSQADVEVTFSNAQFVSNQLVAGGVISMSSFTITQPM